MRGTAGAGAAAPPHVLPPALSHAPTRGGARDQPLSSAAALGAAVAPGMPPTAMPPADSAAVPPADDTTVPSPAAEATATAAAEEDGEGQSWARLGCPPVA